MDSDPGGSDGRKMTGEEIVISGISGYFPDTENIQKLIDNLYNKVDMVKKIEHSDLKHPELPKYGGKVADLNKFDSQFFRFTPWQAASFDAIGRKIMEQAFSAIFDAGINPETLKGTKLGVFAGSSQSDVSTMALYDIFSSNGFVISGGSKTMLANRISYWIDGKGPSYGLDNTCVSSMACLEIACNRIKAGDCDSAIVVGCNLILHPGLTINMRNAGLLCLDGKTKCFDRNGDGYVRSDSVNIIFLQKAKDAKRIYTEICHIKGKYFSKPDALFMPSRRSEDIEKFLNEFYSDIGVSPKSVEYIEANATGIAEADEKELVAIGNIFGNIKVGSIKSNIGHTEAASGMCSLTKLCLSYQRGEIPANLHYNEPLNQVDAVKEGRVQVVTENTKFDRGFTALNNFSYSGANYHVLLKGHYKPKDTTKHKSKIPYLVLVSGRLDQSVGNILNTLENNPIDFEKIALLNNIFKHNIPGHTGRGYTIIDGDNNTSCLARGFEIYDGNTRPIWFLYSGMGSQWPSMGAELMRLPIFAAAIERCNKVLEPKGIDITKIITDKDEKIFENIIHCFVGITAIQLALTEVIKSIGIKPDYIIGHSAGEIASAYADGCMTLEESIMLAYIRGQVSLETKFIKGKMAAVGLGHKEVSKLCPPEIEIACQNSSESTTVSGPAEVVDTFVEFLTERSIFARAVASSNIAYHSSYIAACGPSLMSKMKKVIKIPKKRSKTWFSTSFSPDQWSEEISLYASAEYFTHNILNTVHFEEAARMIPDNAIVIEVAPHGLMQAIVKRSHPSCMNLSLTRRGEKDSVKFLLQSIGTLYQAGLNPDIGAFYPKVEFPVSTETAVLSNLVEWDHTADWPSKIFNVFKKSKTVSFEITMSIHDDDYSYFQGSIRNGKLFFSEAAILVFVWKTLAMYKETDYHNLPVEFENVKFHNEVVIESNEILKLLVEIHKGKNFFEVTQNLNIIATGYINTAQNEKEKLEQIYFVESDQHLNERDIYNLMLIKGYAYEGQFKSIKHTNFEKKKGLVKWDNNWITFLDSLIQLNALSRSHDGVSNLKFITKLLIDVEAHKMMKKVNYDTERNIYYSAQISADNVESRCGGVLFRSIAFDDIEKLSESTDKLQIRKFIPHIPQFSVEFQTALQVNLQIISGQIKRNIRIHYEKNNLFSNIETVFSEIISDPSFNFEIKCVDHLNSKQNETEPDVLFLYNNDKKIFGNICNTVRTKFVIAISEEEISPLPRKLDLVTKFKTENLIMILFKKSNITLLGDKGGGYYYVPVEVKSKLDSVKLVKRVSNGSSKYMWTEIPPNTNSKTVQVIYTGVYLNDIDKDVEISNNLNKYGIGFSGINTRGERVMGILPDGSVSSAVETNYDFLWPVPKQWNLEEAATVPLPYIQAFYCLQMRIKIDRRSTVMITKGDCPLGLAAISLCLNLDCTVFTTVSNVAKKMLLMKIFPKLDESNIGFNMNLSFRHAVLKAARNNRCEFIMNFEKGQMRQESFRFLRVHSMFLDVSDHDMEKNEDYGMAFNEEEKSYISIRLSNIFLPENSNECKKLQLMLSEGIANGSVRPLPRVIYSPDQISRAFKLLSTSNNIGNVLLNMKDPAILENEVNILKRINLSPTKLYIVVCDGTELGVELLEHLIQRGAKQFVIHMKPKLMNGYFHVKYAAWKNNGVIIYMNSDNLYTKSGCESLIKQSQKMGGIDGVFITQNELTNDIAEKIDQDNNDISVITSNLDAASRNCALNYFAVLLYSSQDYNSVAFSEIEKCCFERNEIGLPSLILRYESNEKKNLTQALSKLYSALETSLKQNYISVFLRESKPKLTRLSDTDNISTRDGLGVFLDKIIGDEIADAVPVVSMRTQLNNEVESELYMDPDENYVIMIPGLDSNCEAMATVAGRLKTSAVSLQLELDYVTSISDIAQRLLIIAKKRIHFKSKFYIFGYSFGVNLALELAALLEKEGRTGVVFCLDSSPDVFKKQLIAYTGDMTDEQLQNSVIEHFYNLLTGETYETIKDSQTLEWAEKIDMLIDKVKGSVTHTHQFLKSLVNTAYRRIVMAKDYEPDFNLESEIVLMKGVPHPNSDELSDDYGLSKYSNKLVKVFHLEADHATAPQDIRISNIINRSLDPDLLKDFDTKNLCQYYIS